jgi:hypothetical protein
MKNTVTLSVRAPESLNSAQHRREQDLRWRPDVDVPLTAVLRESHPYERVRSKRQLGDMEAPADAVSSGLLVAQPVTDAEPEEFWDAVALRLRTRTALLEIPRSRCFAFDEAVEPQTLGRDWNRDRRYVR